LFKSARRVRPYGSAMFVITTSYSRRRLAAGAARLEVVTLDSVVGAVEARADLDARLRPASNPSRRLWERIALRHRDIEAWVRHAGSSL
jgi:hypothetical protein